MSKKIATIILTVIFMFIFILVGVGSCGGIKYLINNRSELSLSNVTVYADDDLGTGLIKTKTDYISVSLNKYSFYVDGYRGNGFPSGDSAEFLPLGDLRFVAVYNNDSLFAFYVTTLQVMGYYQAGNYFTEDLEYINTDLTSSNLVNVAFYNSYRMVVEPGCLEFSGPVVDLLSCGKFLEVNVDVLAGDTSVGHFNLSLVFENVTYDYVVSPYRWREYGDYTINRLLNYFSYKEVFTIGSGNAVVNTNEYFKKGYDAAKEEFYTSRYQQGLIDGRTEGFADGVASAGDYTFLSLISSAIDVPVKAVTSMLDFDFLGFNMLEFYKAMLGFAIVVIVLRVIIP